VEAEPRAVRDKAGVRRREECVPVDSGSAVKCLFLIGDAHLLAHELIFADPGFRTELLRAAVEHLGREKIPFLVRGELMNSPTVSRVSHPSRPRSTASFRPDCIYRS